MIDPETLTVWINKAGLFISCTLLPAVLAFRIYTDWKFRDRPRRKVEWPW